jgi:hypothetical protein
MDFTSNVSWIQIGHETYRKSTLYHMGWRDIKPSECLISFSENGGPIALTSLNADSSSHSNDLLVFTCSGMMIGKVEVRKKFDKLKKKKFIIT